MIQIHLRALVLACATALTTLSVGTGVAEPPPTELPQVTPQPQQVQRLGEDLPVPDRVSVVVDSSVDQSTRDLVVRILRSAGANKIDVVPPGTPPRTRMTVRVGLLTRGDVADGLRDAGVRVPPDLAPEGYAVAAKDDTVVLGGVDGDGLYYSAQTLRQLNAEGSIAGAGIVDYPLMPLRGAIEGFYGSPWTHQERLDQLAFYGDVKLNTYIYAPKDDPYHREKWREPYPPQKLDELRQLIERAKAHHVRFTFALSPGLSICYSDQRDWEALTAKLQAMYDLGVRAFSVPLDDIDYEVWNCDADAAEYGPASPRAAGQAQVDLLNRIQREFLDTHRGTKPLQSVPTEYSDTEDSPYKRTIREQLDERVEMMWTGVGVIPQEITVEQAEQAATVWGRKVFVWDNYPVNDFDETAGRLLLAPYDKREPGLHDQLSGIVLNPMNQASASKVAEFTAADFIWNDTAYNADRAHREAARYLAGGDQETTRALLAFFDLEHLAPTTTTPWQPQAPVLEGRLKQFRTVWSEGDRQQALDALRPYAELIAAAPQRISKGVVDPAFVADAEPWLRATGLWGDAFVLTLDGLQSRIDGDDATAKQRFAKAAKLSEQAAAIRPIPGETRPEGPVKVGDGVLDVFLAEAPRLR